MNQATSKDLSPEDIEVFVSAVDQYFGKITQEQAQIKGAYLGDDKLPSLDCTGVIEVSGAFTGCIYYTAPLPMMRHLLIAMRENNQNMDNMMDAVGEIANTIAGRSREYFGAGLEIKPPIKTNDVLAMMQKTTREYPYVIAIRWKQYRSALVVDIVPKH